MLQTISLQRLVFGIAGVLVVLLVECCRPAASQSTDGYVFVKAHEEGDPPSDYLYLGGLFGVHSRGEWPDSCAGVRESGIQNLEAFLWAVNTYQTRHPDSLKGVRIGALGFDSCSDSFHLRRQVANFRRRLVDYGSPPVDPRTLLGFVGPDVDDEAVDLASYLGRRGPVVVSPAATSVLLSDKDKYPYFLRTVPSDATQSDAVVRILVRLSWRYVQLVYGDDVFARAQRETFTSAAAKEGICVVSEQTIAASMSGGQWDAVMATLKDNEDTRAVVVLAGGDAAHALLVAARASRLRGRFTWFGTTAWAEDRRVTRGVEEQAEGAVTLSLGAPSPSDADADAVLAFDDHFGSLTPQANDADPWFKEYWSDKFRCYFPDVPNPRQYNLLCDDMEGSLPRTELDAHVPYTIKAVDAVLSGIDKARRNTCQLLYDKLCDELIADGMRKTIFDSVLKQDDLFNGSTGDALAARYSIYNYRIDEIGPCSGHCYQRVGQYSTSFSGVLDLNEARVHTYNVVGMRVYEASSTCGRQPCGVCGETAPPTKTTTESVTGAGSVEEGGAGVALRSARWIIPLLVLACVGVLLVVAFDAYLLCKIFGTPYMKHWRTMWLGQLLLIGILLSYLTLIAFVVTPTAASCAVIRIGVGVSCAMCFAVLLVKLLILLSSESFGYLKGAFQILMFLFAWGIQVVIDAEWLLLRRPDVVRVADDPEAIVCRHADFVSHVESLVYVMLLIVLCTGMAIRTSRISTNHREGVFIGLSAGFTIPIWLVWILVGTLYDGADVHDICLAFGLLATATLLLFVMFLPKVRQLNSMGVEGIYAEDDAPDFAGSVVHGVPDAVQPAVIGYANSKPPSLIEYTATTKAGEGSVILMPNGETYATAVRIRPVVKPDPTALYLRHPGSQSIESASVRSAPLAHNYAHGRPQSAEQSGDRIRTTTRVLRVTTDLTGRKTPDLSRKANSELNQEGSRPASRNSDSKSELGRLHTITDLGSL